MISLQKYAVYLLTSFFIIFTSCVTNTTNEAVLDFKTYTYNDKIHLFGNENYPSYDLDISISLPKDTVNFPELSKELTQTYFDSLYQPQTHIDNLLFLSAQIFTQGFKNLEDNFKKDSLDVDVSFNWQLISKNEIIYVNEEFVSFMNEFYSYSGGAHGNTERNYFVFDRKEKKLLSVSDFFADPFCDKLKELQIASLKKAGHNLDEFWLENLQCLGNFYILEAGMIFHYNQYEIASYATGPIDVFISFEEIMPLLKHPQKFKPISQISN
jgi:hypothetical protein